MAEFKFPCPQCGQHIQCDTGYVGMQIDCPICKRVILVPQPPRPADAPAVSAKSQTMRNVLAITAVVVVLVGLVISGWFGYAKIRSRNNVHHALEFNLGNRVEIPNDRALQFGDSPFTISFWVKTASERPLMSFISKRSNSMGDGWVVHQDHGQLLFYCAGCAAPKSKPVSIRDNKWHHLLLTRSGNQITFYLDGKNVGSGETRCNHYDNNSIRIGMDGDGDSWHFEGEISEVHIYGRTLGQKEVVEEWNNGRGLVREVAGGGLIAGYHFDEGQGDTAKDFSGNNHDGRLINSPERKN